MTPTIGIDMQRIARAGAIADAAVMQGQHPTALVAVANSGGLVWSHLVPGNDGVTEDSIFLLASITKPIVGTAIMQLVEQGRLLLHLPVATYIPAFAANGKERVTTWHLLTHTSGLEEIRFFEELRGRDVTNDDYVDATCRAELHFEPGTRCEYCSLSFAVLGELISRLSGTPYPEYLRQNIFAPLNMHDTGFRPADPQRAAPVHNFGGPKDQEQFTNAAMPGGGLWSTAADLVSFGRAYLHGGRLNGSRILGLPAIETITRNHTAGMTERVNGYEQPFNYGLGWGKPDANGNLIGSLQAYEHGGATGTLLWVDPTWDLVVIFLTNSWGIEHDTHRRVLNAVYGSLDVL